VAEVSEIQTLVTSSESRLEELESDLKSLQNTVREWSKTWAQVMTSLNLPVDTTLDQAAAALDVWQQVPSTLTQLDDRSRRVQGMKRDMESFEAHTSALFTQLGELEMGIGVDAAIKTLAGRLTKALQTESMASMANERVKELQAQILTAAANLSSAEARHSMLSARACHRRHSAPSRSPNLRRGKRFSKRSANSGIH
jgi:chromosome segregation protein